MALDSGAGTGRGVGRVTVLEDLVYGDRVDVVDVLAEDRTEWECEPGRGEARDVERVRALLVLLRLLLREIEDSQDVRVLARNSEVGTSESGIVCGGGLVEGW